MKKPLLMINLNHKYDFWRITEQQLSHLKKSLPEYEIKKADSKEEAFDLIQEAVIYYGWSFPEEWIAIAKKLKWIHTPSAGKDYIDSPSLRKSGIVFTNTLGFHGRFMAQHAMGMLLYFSRGLQISREKFWPRDEIASEYFDLINEKMLIVGCGSIGVKLASLAKAFEMEVVGYKRSKNSLEQDIKYVHTIMDCLAEAKEARVIVNLLPHTAETHEFFNEDFFNKIGLGKVFLNLGRGKTVNEVSLLNAINKGIIQRAGLDVVYSEPPENNTALYSHPKVLITPHSSAFSKYYLDDALSDLVARVNQIKKDHI